MSLRDTPEEGAEVLQSQQPNGGGGNSSYNRQSVSTASLSSRDGQSPRHSATTALQSLKARFFTSKEKERRQQASLMTTEGSIHQNVWYGLDKGNPKETRIRFVNQLLDVVRNNQLQVSTLEGLYHDMIDLVDEDSTRDPVVRLMAELTANQQYQVGLALRQEFFKKIRELGCEPWTLKWLTALSQNGERIDGFERDMDFMLAAWVKDHLFEDNQQLALDLLELTIQLIQRNSAYICASALTDIVRSVCIMGCKIPANPKAPLDQKGQELQQKCLDLLDAVLKYSDVPRDLVLYVIPVICIQVCNMTFREKAWHLTKLLLTSQMGHRTRLSIQALLEDTYPMSLSFDRDLYNLMIRGAVFCLANAVWGHQKIENMSCSPANILPSFTKVISKSPDICIDVFTATKRLVQKYGSELQPLVWLKLLDLFNEALDHFKKVPEFNEKCALMLKVQLSLAEQYHRENQFSASTEKLFEFIERAVDFYPDSPASSLIEYKFNRITPQTPNFIEAASVVVQRYAHPKQHQERRKKAVQHMSEFFIRYRMLYETELAEKLVLPVVRNITQEKNPAVQYQLIVALFDIARHVSFRGQVDLFGCAMLLVKKVMNMAITDPETETLDEVTEETASDKETVSESLEGSSGQLFLTLDNLECIVKSMEEVISERWDQLTLKNLTIMTNILIEHLDAQYKAGWTSDIGSPIRESVVNTLLSLQCCPITNRIQRVARADLEPRPNLLIKRKCVSNENGFIWSDICRITTEVLKHDTDWQVIKTCLERLGKILENMSFVRTADKQLVNNLCSALVNLHQRAENKEIEMPQPPPEREGKTDNLEYPTEENLSKYLPPVLAILLNYTSLYHSGDNRNNEICRVLVDCVDSDHLEGLMAIDVAVQLVPDAMASNAFKLLDILKRLEPSSKRAIPLIEFMSDSAEIMEFHRFFNDQHYRTVADILIPYADVNKFNAYIVSCIHRILMRWYTQIPVGGVGPAGNARFVISKYITDQFINFPLLSALSLEPMRRQYSGDGRTVENPFLLGGDPATPPPESKFNWNGARGMDKIHKELLTAMQTFFVLGKIDPESGSAAHVMQQAPKDKYDEVSVEHYFQNDTLISIRRLVDKKWKQSLDDAAEDDVFTSEGELGSPSSPNEFAPSSFDQRKEERRRYASAKHVPRSASVKPTSKALDDLYAAGGPHHQKMLKNVKRPLLSFVQMTTRHMYGRSSWLLRTLDEWPEDFERSAAMPSSSHAFMSQIKNVPGTLTPLLCSRNEHEIRDFDRALKVLDNLPGIEHHVVGVLYMAPKQEDQSEVLANIYGSERYNRFIRLLGDVIPLKNCPGGLREEIHGKYTFAHTDALSTIIYQIATLMPKDLDDKEQNCKKMLIGNNHVTIVFNESGKPYKAGLVSKNFDSVTLEIIPSDFQTVVVTVHAKSEIACWLAMKRVLLTDVAASRLVRKLVVRSYLSVRVFNSLSKGQSAPYISSGVERLRKLYAIRDKYTSLPVP